MEQPLIWETRGPVAIITLNRPQAMNSFDMDLMEAHREKLREFEADDDLQALVYTGTGRAFSCGIDIRKAPNFLNLSPEERTSYWVTPNSLGINKPSIAAINGYAVGGGFELALGCDMRIAGQSAKMGLPEVKLGALPGGGGTQYLPRLVGMGNALMMMLTGEPVDADEAMRLGIVQKVVPDEDLLDEAVRLAETICDNGRSAVRLTKEVAMKGINKDLPDALWLEETYFARNRDEAADEIAERVRKFQERSARKKQ